jgi:hypothetical protein
MNSGSNKQYSALLGEILLIDIHLGKKYRVGHSRSLTRTCFMVKFR